MIIEKFRGTPDNPEESFTVSAQDRGLSLEETTKEAELILRRKRRDTIVQSAGLAVFLFGMIAAALTIGLSGSESRPVYLVMLFVSCAGIWLAAYRFRYIAIIVGGLQMLVYTVYQLYGAFANGKSIVPMDYAWLVLPVILIAAMIMFMTNMHKVEKLTEILEDKIQSMEVIEPVTGLNNLRSMYVDLERQMAYARRNNLELTLILLELRYYQELKSILSAEQFSDLKRRMARLAEETLRLEDRVYAIDDRGSLGIVCIGCGRDGAMIVRDRIVSVLSQKESFEEILDRALRVDVRAGFYLYDSEEIKNAIEFKQRVENELQYDV